MYLSTNFLLRCMMSYFAQWFVSVLVCLVVILTHAVKNIDSWKTPESEPEIWELTRIQKGASFSYFLDADSRNYLRGSAWRNLQQIVWNYFLRSLLLLLEELSVRKHVQSTSCLIHKVQLSLSLANSSCLFLCTGVYTIIT